MYYQPRVRSDKPFPLADNFFDPVDLSGQRLHDLRAEAALALRKTLAECAEYQQSRGTYLVDCPPWRLHVEQDGLSEYKRAHERRPTASHSRLFGTVAGDYLDLATFFKSETRAEYFNVQKKLFHFAIDAQVVASVPQQHSNHDAAAAVAYECIKWAAYEPFTLRFRMDTCHFESTGTGVDAHGKPYAYRVLIPVKLPEVPDLFKSKRTVRSVCQSVMLLMPSDRDGHSTELFMTMENDFKSNQVPRSMYKRYMMSLHKISAHMESRRLASKTSVLLHSELVPESQRCNCAVCARAFSMLRSKHHCSVCGEVVCRRCLVRSSDILQVKVSREERKQRAKTKLCTPCIQLMKEDHDHAVTTPMLGTDGKQVLWIKSPNGNTVRMSETPTEGSNGDPTLTYIRGSSFTSSDDAGRRSSLSDWTTTPTSKHQQQNNKSRGGRFSIDQNWHRESSSSRHSSCSSASEGLRSPVISVIGEAHEQIEYIDDEDVIYEEEVEMASNRSVEIMDLSDIPSNRSVDLVLDTSEMTRVRDNSVLSDDYTRQQQHQSRRESLASVLSRPTSSSVSSDVFENIHSSLHEQEALLRQLQLVASGHRGRRNTRESGYV